MQSAILFNGLLLFRTFNQENRMRIDNTHTLYTCAHIYTHTHKKNALINNHWLLFPNVLDLSSPSLCIAPLVHIVSVLRPNEKRKKGILSTTRCTNDAHLLLCVTAHLNQRTEHAYTHTRNTETSSNAPPFSRRGEPPRPPSPRAQYLAFLPAASSIAASLLLNAVAPLRSSVERWRRKRQ